MADEKMAPEKDEKDEREPVLGTGAAGDVDEPGARPASTEPVYQDVQDEGSDTELGGTAASGQVLPKTEGRK